MPRSTKNTMSPDSAVIEMRHSLAQRITALAGKAGEHSTAIPGLFLYYRTTPTPCYRASYEPSLSVFVQGRKRIILGAPSICAMDRRFCCHRSTCLHKARSLKPRRKCRCSVCFCASTCRRSGRSSAVTTCPKLTFHRTVKGSRSVRRLSDCWAHVARCLSFLRRLRTFRSSAT